jgi:isopenicillin N synthase-like dioxygenase
MIRYSAQGRSYFEGTGEQKNMDETVFQDRQLIVEPINMSGGLKHGMKIKLLRIMERHLIRWPKSVSGIRIQLSKYDEQLDKMSSKLQQDIVTTLFIAASKLGDRMLESGDIDRREGLLRKSVRGAGGNRKARQVTSRARR